jgi:stage II sporulation protein D
MAAAYLSKIPNSQPGRAARVSQPARAAATIALALALLATAVAQAKATTMLYIRGGGNGHGIGMSQYGSYGYALHGKDYKWILAHYYQGTSLGHTNPNRTVRVLLQTGSASFSGANAAGTKALDPNKTYSLTANADGTLALHNASGKKIGAFQAPLTVTGTGPLDVVGLGLYRGSLVYRPDGSGGVQTVEAVGLDDYVRGVISAEMPSSWSAEALETQAVAARTYAITTDVQSQDFDVYPDTRSQMYRGIAAETPQTDAAVAATRGQVVTYGGNPVVTYFSASSGGYTENIENVWPGATPEPWLKGVADPYDGVGGNPYHRWGSDLSIASASASLKRYLKGSLIGIKITKHGVSPRILTAQVLGSKGATNVTGGQLQQAFGLLTTYAAFTTITTLPGRAPTPATARDRLPSGSSQSQAVVALVPLVHNLVAGAVLGIHGGIYPAVKGVTVSVQRLDDGSWRTVAHTSTAPDGTYDLAVQSAGTYRIVYRGIDGPAIAIS